MIDSIVNWMYSSTQLKCCWILNTPHIYLILYFRFVLCIYIYIYISLSKISKVVRGTNIQLCVRLLGNEINLFACVLIGWWWSFRTVSCTSSLIACSRWSHDLIEILWRGSGITDQKSSMFLWPPLTNKEFWVCFGRTHIQIMFTTREN